MTSADLSFSVIINTTDRAQSLAILLAALEQQSYPHFEVVAVVGPTRDNTLDLLHTYDNRIRILRCPRANLSQSRNIGLQAARGEVVAFIDDDAVPCRNWLWQLRGLFADPTLDATGGDVFLIHPDRPLIQNRLAIASALGEMIDVRSDLLADLPPAGAGRFWAARMMGTNMAYRRSSLLEIGGFDEYFEWVFDDTDLALRLTAAGKRVQPVRAAAVYHVPASSRNRTVFTPLGRWWIQTRAAVYFAIKHGRAAAESRRAVTLRVLHLIHGHWKWLGEVNRAGQIDARHLLTLRSREVEYGLRGLWAGLFQPRRTLAAPLPEPLAGAAPEPLRPFQTASSSLQPQPDPVDGRRPQIQLSEPPLRICLLSGAYPPDQYEGVGRHTNLMARGLFELGHTVHVIARGTREQVTFYDGAYVHRIPTAQNRYDRYRALPNLQSTLNYSHSVHEKVRLLLLNDDVQLVDSPVWQVEGIVTAQSGLLPVVVRPQTAVRQIARLQQTVNDDQRLVGDLEAALIARAAYLVPNSEATVAALRSVYALGPQARYLVVPHGIVPAPEEQLRPFDPSRAAAPRTVLYVGRLEQRKGIQDLFAAIPAVLAQHPDARFIIAGADNSLSDGFQARHGMDYPTYFARRYPVARPAVQFLGHVAEETLQALYQQCDLFVAPSLYESFGLIYLEAMNYAKPVIGCRAGGVPEVVEDGVTGRLVEPEAPAQLAEAIAALLAAPQQLREMGLAGRARLVGRFSYLAMARGFEQVYRAVLQLQADRRGS